MALCVLAVLQGGVAVPSTPGKIGVFHYLCILALSIFGVPAAVGLGYGLILHVLVIGGISAWAALALWQRSLNLRQLTAAAVSRIGSAAADTGRSYPAGRPALTLGMTMSRRHARVPYRASTLDSRQQRAGMTLARRHARVPLSGIHVWIPANSARE